MSGGVDSSFAAHLLRVQGYRVIGVTFELLPLTYMGPTPKPCCSAASVMHAKEACENLGIEHHVVDSAHAFGEFVVRSFVEEYRSGRTPNPCITCNEKIKFPMLAKFADSMGCTSISTGHYARLFRGGGRKTYLAAALDAAKDQSYFLYRVPVSLLERSVFPLGEIRKEEVSAEAVRLGFGSAVARESQDICFLPYGDLKTFLAERGIGGKGDVVDPAGRIIGHHRGIASYTIGQRKGLGISGGTPLYITSIDAERNIIMLGTEAELYRSAVSCRNVRLRVRDFEGPMLAKIRYGHQPAEVSSVERRQGGITVRFKEPQRAITPGQSLVLYRHGLVIGGGVIDSTEDP